MSWFHAAKHRVVVLFRSERYAQQQRDELTAHLELEAQQHQADGAFAARRKFGNLTQMQESAREAAGMVWIDRLKQDTLYALRTLQRSPGFTITIVLTLTLGVGANVAIYSFLDRVFYQVPAGVVEPATVRRVYREFREGWPTRDTGTPFIGNAMTYPEFAAMRDAIGTRASVAAESEAEAIAVVTDSARIRARGNWVSANYLAVLGMRPQLGRFFADDESRIDVPADVAVLTDAFWRRSFGGRRDVLGKTIRIGRRSYTIIGVTPPGFTGIALSADDIFLSLSSYAGSPFGGKAWYQVGNTGLSAIARIGEGSEAPIAALATNAARRAEEAWQLEANQRPVVDTVSRVLFGPIIEAQGPGRRAESVAIALRLGAVALTVLLIACANMGTLLLVRTMRRRREIAVRLALGVSRTRLASQLLLESLLLAAIGVPGAIAFALWGSGMFRRLLVPTANWQGSAINWRAAAIAIGAALVVSVLAGIAPILQSMRTDLTSALKAGSQQVASYRQRLRTVLLIVQTALSLVLVVVAGLFVRSFQTVAALPIGYDAEHVLLASLPIEDSDPDQAGTQTAMEGVAARLRLLPGVKSAGLSRHPPMGGTSSWRLYLPASDGPMHIGRAYPSNNNVSAEYFDAVGLTIIEGRTFTPRESHVMVIDETMARGFWPGESPIGKCVYSSTRNAACTIVIGVVGNVKRFRRIEEPTMQWYSNIVMPRVIALRIDKTRRQEIALILRDELRRNVPFGEDANMRMMSDDLDRELRPWRLYAAMFTAFGILALVVAGVGIYSVVAYSVHQRVREMGIRIALGANVRDVLNLVIGEGTRTLALGLGVGLALATALSGLVASLVYGVSPRDPFVMLGAACALLGVGIVASLGPAIQAAKTDPLAALKAD